MVSLSIALKQIVLIRFPFGGSVTLGKYVPLILLSYKSGTKTAVLASFAYSVINLIFSFKIPPVKNFYYFALLIFLEYFLPYMLVGFVSFLGWGIRNKNLRIYASVVTLFILKILLSSISGIVFWSEYIPKEFNIWIYCIIYNSAYLIPECLITLILLKYMISRSHNFLSG